MVAKLRHWAPPPQHWCKINVDAAFSPSSSVACFGCVVRDSFGSWVHGWSSRCFATTPFLSEVLAIREEIRFAILSTDNFVIASDCINAVKTILSSDHPCGPFANIFIECRELLKASPRLELVFETRSANRVADAVAKFSAADTSLANGCFIWELAPSFVTNLCFLDFLEACTPLNPDPPP
ncbi:uncharacterized protein LOC141595778 [Silene latifolia]|uniref:uncharacterized protein LOC141595778 n=1 Tax=Silene latifolia TaxID=37657 RepID=UPI003D774D78